MWLSRSASLLGRQLKRASWVLNGVGAVALVALMFLITVDVAMRAAFTRPVRGAFELTQIMTLILVYLGLAYCTSEKGHIRVDLLISFAPKRFRAVVDAIVSLFSLSIVSLIVWGSVILGMKLQASEAVSTILSMPLYPFVYLLSAGCVVTCLVMLADFLEDLARVTR